MVYVVLATDCNGERYIVGIFKYEENAIECYNECNEPYEKPDIEEHSILDI